MPDGVRWLLWLLRCPAEGEKSLTVLSLPHQQCATTAPGKKPQPSPTVCDIESSASDKAGPRRRQPRCSRNTRPRKAEQPASQRSQNLHKVAQELPLGTSTGQPSGYCHNCAKSQKAVTVLALIAEEPYPPISFDFFNS